MATSSHPRAQAAAGLEQLAFLMRAQAWRGEGAPALPPTQAGVLRILAGAEPELRARQLAERLDVSPASLSDSLKSLAGRGWIRRRADPDDRRAVLVRLSRQGRGVAVRLNHPGRGMAGLLQGLDDADVAALLRVAQLLIVQAQQQGLANGLRTCLGCRFFQPYASGDPLQPHVCGFTGTPFGDLDLRIDCAEREPAAVADAAAMHDRFQRAIAMPELTREQEGGARLASDAARSSHPP